MQKNESSKFLVRPSGVQLRTFAERLSSLHPADIRHILWAIAEFGYQFYPMIDAHSDAPVKFVDQLHEATDSAHTLGMVFREVSEYSFPEFVADVARVFDLAIEYFTSTCNDDRYRDAYVVLAQLRHLRNSLKCDDAATSLPLSARHQDSYRALSSHLAIFAGICIAALIWVLASDHLPLWQLLAALVLVGAFGGLVFRLGQKAATGLRAPVT